MISTRRCRTVLLQQSLMLLSMLIVATQSVAADKPKKLSFERDVLPILRRHCLKCHSGKNAKGKLDLASRKSLLQGGKSGAVIRVAAAETSLLWAKLAANQMPPVGPKLTATDKGIIRKWINDGALGSGKVVAGNELNETVKDSERDFWSFQPPQRPPFPAAKTKGVRHPVDRFVVARLKQEEAGLQLSPTADRITLIRRLNFDLLGIPPLPEQVTAFVADNRPDAYERLVDRLLADPRYGERWGRHWLDLAGYADSAGILSEDRPLQLIYRYRDYVIRALNRDKPYDVFLREQLAGDELYDYWTEYEQKDRLSPQVIEGLTATGFLRCSADSSRPDFVTIKNAAAQYFYPTLNDTIKIVASATMGLTLQCAKCHSHKYDPIPQVDYYRVQAIFMSAYRVDKWVPQMKRNRTTASLQQEQTAKKKNAAIVARVKQLQTGLVKLRKQLEKQYMEEQKRKLVPQNMMADVFNAMYTPPKQRTVLQRYLAGKYRKRLLPTSKEFDSILPRVYPQKYAAPLAKAKAEIAAQQRQRMAFDSIRSLYDLPGEAKTPFLRRGDPLTPGAEVRPGVLAAIDAPQTFRWTKRHSDKTTGRRLAFANWLTQPRHPLTARVIVNRVWLHHFGEGIVGTPEDFGYSGMRPTHPKLLDWLAVEFVEQGWSLKQLHRLILTSQTYRQTSTQAQSPRHQLAAKLDPENRLLWRQRMRRLEAEPVRDSVLAVAGKLSTRMYGYPTRMARQPDGEVVTSGPGPHRRSIYMQVLRGNPLTMMQAFDQPVMETNCLRRSQSTVSTQALTQLNSQSMIAAAAAMAERVLLEEKKDPVRYAVRLAFCRAPTDTESQAMEQFLVEQARRYRATGQPGPRQRALADLCHMLLCANEFIYID